MKSINMKKLKTIAFAIACLIISPLILSACSKTPDAVTVSSVTISGLESNYMTTASEDLLDDLDAVTLLVTYSDNTTATLALHEYDKDSADYSTTEFILQTSGLRSTALTNPMSEGSYTIKCTLVSDGKTYDLTSVMITDTLSVYYNAVKFNAPELLDTYNANKTRFSDTDEDSFYTTASYYVGNDNAFEFVPSLYVVSIDEPDYDNLIQITNFDLNVTVTHNAQTLDLTNNNYVTYSYDSSCSFYFTDLALDEEFTITISLADFDKDYAGNDFDSYSLTVTVADGWNVYDALDLGRMNIVSNDNLNPSDYINATQIKFWDANNGLVTKNTFSIWKTFLTEKGEENLTSINGIFLHANITVTNDDIPSEFIITQAEVSALDSSKNYDTEALVGSIRDWTYLYQHFMESSDFTFNGNLFKIDSSNLKWGQTNSSNDTYYYDTSTSKTMGHSSLFMFNGLENSHYTTTFCNLESMGNTQGILEGTDDDDGTGASGSLIFLKSARTTVVVNNVICKNYMIGYSSESNDSSYAGLTITYAKIYDSYSSGLYTWNSTSNTITNSEIKRTGGPAAMLVDNVESSNTKATGFEFINTTVSCYVGGSEAWFAINQAISVATTFRTLDSSLRKYGKTFLNSDEEMNLLAIIMDKDYMGSNEKLLDADFTYNGSTFHLDSDATAETDYTSYLINTFIAAQFKSEQANRSPIFVTNTGKVLMTNGTYFFELTNYMAYYADNTTTLVPVKFSEEDTTLYILYPYSNTVVGVAVTLSDYASTSD